MGNASFEVACWRRELWFGWLCSKNWQDKEKGKMMGFHSGELPMDYHIEIGGKAWLYPRHSHQCRQRITPLSIGNAIINMD